MWIGTRIAAIISVVLRDTITGITTPMPQEMAFIKKRAPTDPARMAHLLCVIDMIAEIKNVLSMNSIPRIIIVLWMNPSIHEWEWGLFYKLPVNNTQTWWWWLCGSASWRIRAQIPCLCWAIFSWRRRWTSFRFWWRLSTPDKGSAESLEDLGMESSDNEAVLTVFTVSVFSVSSPLWIHIITAICTIRRVSLTGQTGRQKGLKPQKETVCILSSLKKNGMAWDATNPEPREWSSFRGIHPKLWYYGIACIQLYRMILRNMNKWWWIEGLSILSSLPLLHCLFSFITLQYLSIGYSHTNIFTPFFGTDAWGTETKEQQWFTSFQMYRSCSLELRSWFG